MEKEKTIGMKIYQLRKERNVSQETLAEALDVSRQSVSRWESGSNIPEMAKIIEIAKYFEVSVSYLLDGETGSEGDVNNSEKVEQLFESFTKSVSNQVDAYHKKTVLMFQVFAASLMAVVICVMALGIVKINTLNNQIEYLQSNYSSVQSQYYALQSQINNLSSTQTESEVFSNIEIDFGTFDLDNNTVEVVFDLSLKQFTDQTEIAVAINNGSEIVRGDLKVENGIVSSGKIVVPLSNNFDIIVTISDNGNKQNEILPSLNGAIDQTMVKIVEGYNGHVLYNTKNGNYNEEQGMVVNFGEIVFAEMAQTLNGELLYATEITSKIYINDEFVSIGRVISEEEYDEWGMVLPDVNAENGDKYHAVVFDDTAIKTGDEIDIKLDVTDSLGRSYEIHLATYQVTEDGSYLIASRYYEVDYVW